MPTPARARLARLLAGAEPTRADSTMLRLPGDTLALEVDGLGAIPTPIRAAQAKQLIGAARPAEFGHGEQTLSDDSVRDTWVIDPDRVRLGGPGWQSQLDQVLAHVTDELGLPDGARLTAELHSLLVYGKGQFFLPHQDSEKHDGMVASLVVMLPSVHTGGALVVDDAGTAKTYTGSRDELTLVAFYADRRHEVRPVRSGHRVSLTFNLLLTAPETEASDGPVAAASAALTEHFTTRAVSEFGGRDLGEPTRLAFLLDHEYTQAALTSGRFKGADAERVATLRAAAAQVGCESVLALAEIKETWDVVPERDSWRYDWYGDEDEDDDGDEDGDEDVDEDVDDHDEPDGQGDYDLNELIDDEIVLGWWTSPGGGAGQTISLALSEHEVCSVTPTVSLTPYESEYEGYMGNYGNTLDRWYRRAAVVVWPADRAFAARAEASSAWALQTLLERIAAGDLERARVDAVSLEPFWRRIESALLSPALQVAAGLADASAGRVVAAPFRIEAVGPEHAPLLAALARTYGEPWSRTLLGAWTEERRFTGNDRLGWISGSLVPVCTALRAEGADALADACAGDAWRHVHALVAQALATAHPAQRRAALAALGVPAARVLEAASDDLARAIAATLTSGGDAMLELSLPLLRAHRGAPSPAVEAIAADTVARLAALAEAPVREQGDWSIAWSGCGCELCERLAAFLGSATETTLEWPIAQARRQHVHRQIDDADLPVRHVTRRKGSPYTLVLTKTRDLFEREADARARASADLAWARDAFEDPGM